jgi:hypothetical protein
LIHQEAEQLIALIHAPDDSTLHPVEASIEQFKDAHGSPIALRK